MRERKYLKTVKAYVNVKVVAVTEALAQFQLLKKKEPSFFPALESLAELWADCLPVSVVQEMCKTIRGGKARNH